MKKLELIKYHNDLQSVNINHLSLQESKVFIRLIQEVQNKQDELLNISFEDFKSILTRNTTDKELINLINSSTNKAISSYITITNETKTKITKFTFFNKFVIDLDNKNLIAQVNKEFLYLINELIKNYSTLLLSEAISFNSKYSLLMYKKIREFYKQEKLEWNFETFKEYLNIINQPIRYINDKVLSQINKELPNVFKNFHIKKIKEKRKIIKLLFTWKYESNKDKLNSN